MIYNVTDFHFGNTVVSPRRVDQGGHFEEMRLDITDDVYPVMPGEFVLMDTQELYHVPLGTMLLLSGRSTLARQGLSVHCTSCLVDPGFEGTITLEIYNCGNSVVDVYPGMRAGKAIWMRCGLNIPAYEGRYQGQNTPSIAREKKKEEEEEVSK